MYVCVCVCVCVCECVCAGQATASRVICGGWRGASGSTCRRGLLHCPQRGRAAVYSISWKSQTSAKLAAACILTRIFLGIAPPANAS